MNSCTKIIINSEVSIDTSDLSITNLTTGKLIRLRPLPFKVLIYLYENKGKCITRNELFSECWNGAIVSDQALTNVISNLRKSLLEVNAYNVILKTVSKVGYILEHRDAGRSYRSEKEPEVKTNDICIEGIRSSEDDNEQKNVLKNSKIRYLKEKLWRIIFFIAISLLTFILPITPPLANTDNDKNNEFEILSENGRISYFISGGYTELDIKKLRDLFISRKSNRCEANEIFINLLKNDSNKINFNILVKYKNRANAKLINYSSNDIYEVFRISRTLSICDLA